jgi:hypothetical protein
MSSGGHHNQELIMRKTIFALMFSVCAGAASANNVLNASGVADTALTAVNTTVNGHAMGVWAQATSVNGYIGTGLLAEGTHFGATIKAGPGDGYLTRGINLEAYGNSGVTDVWGIQGSASGPEWVHGVEMYAATDYGEASGFTALASASSGSAAGFTANGTYSNTGNAYGLRLINNTSSTYASGFGAELGDVYSGSHGYGVHVNSVTAGGNVAAYNGENFSGYDAYGLRLANVTGSNASHGVAVNAYGNNVTYGAALYGSTNWSNGYGVYAIGNANSGDAYGVYASASSSSGTPYAGVFNGDVLASGSVCWPCSPSDEMFKKNVKPMTGGLNTIMALKPKTYDMKADEFKDRIVLPKGKQRGFLAQELQAVVPEVVKEVSWPAALSPEEMKNGVKKENLKFKAVNYTALIPILVEAMQEQQALIQELEAKVARLEAR